MVIPFPQSNHIQSLTFSGRYRNYTNADTWYPSWASDGHLYSPWTDGYILDAHNLEAFTYEHPGYACNSLDYMGRKAATAQARIRGDDPLNLHIDNLTPRIEAAPDPYGGRYPCANLVYDGIWYYGTYCVDKSASARDLGIPDWDVLGPLVGFRTSTDDGKTWVETDHTPTSPIFGENPAVGPVKIGAPHFVDFGQNMQHSPDGYAYLVAHGSANPNSPPTWIGGDQIYLPRVKPSPETINDPSAYEFFAGYDAAAHPKWTSDFKQIQPLLHWPGNLGCVAVTYNAPLEKYLMCVSKPVEIGHYDALFLEASSLTGPWYGFHTIEKFGPEAYFINIPTKFISEDGKTMWLCYSANWSDKHRPGDPEGSLYSLSLHEVRLQLHNG